MKKILIGLTALSLVLFLAAGATAKAPAPPKNLCLQLGGGFDYVKFSLVLKMAGTINTASGPVKFYTISGEMTNGSTQSVPVTGTGHMNGTKFHFSLTGSCQPTGMLTISTYDLSFSDYDFLTGGDVLVRRTDNASVGSSFTYAMAPWDCKASVIPFNAEAAAAPGPVSLVPGQ